MMPRSSNTRLASRAAGRQDSNGRERSNQSVQTAAGSTGAVRKTIRTTGFG